MPPNLYALGKVTISTKADVREADDRRNYRAFRSASWERSKPADHRYFAFAHEHNNSSTPMSR